MLENNLEKFSNHVTSFLTGEKDTFRGLLVKKHTENFHTNGDYSFPNTLQTWQRFIDPNVLSNASQLTYLEYIGKEGSDLISQSTKWNLQVLSVKEVNNRIFMFLDRAITIRIGLLECLHNSTFVSLRLQEDKIRVTIKPRHEKDYSVTSLRVQYLACAVQNIYAINAPNEPNPPHVYICSKSHTKNGFTVFCGPVLNVKSGAKEKAINAEEYIKARQSEMMLIAQHKYGLIVSTEDKWKGFIETLGESAAKFELLKTKSSAGVKINFDYSSAGCSKGGAFILYNCARLETLCMTFNEKVSEGIYPPLPHIDDTDFSLLTQEDEWCLIFNYIMGFPTMITNCVEFQSESFEFRPHLVCNFLSSMVKVFSQYYSRSRILTEPRNHLLPVLYARIHMLSILNTNLKLCLKILNIKSVTQM